VTQRRVALLDNAFGYVGPELAILLAEDGHDLVLGAPADGLVERCEAAGARVVTLGRDELGPDHEPAHARVLVKAAKSEFGRIDSAMTFTGAILTGWFLKDASTEQLNALTLGLINAPFEFLHAIVPEMVAQGSGQVLVITSATAARTTPRAPLYSALRAGADHLIRNVAAEVAPRGVQVNGLGTNYMNFPQYWDAVGGDTPERRAKVEAQVPMAPMGELHELAHFCKVFLDGKMGFATGQTVQFDGGWSV
jgi:NAD(P)-dependent dehydrogenase (short-subunit alcohol dehydrogenase family)